MSERKISIDHLHESPRLKPDAVEILAEVLDRIEETQFKQCFDPKVSAVMGNHLSPLSAFQTCRMIVSRKMIELLREVEKADAEFEASQTPIEQPEPEVAASCDASSDYDASCGHGEDPAECDACDRESDFQHDAARERSFFGRHR